MRRPPAWGLPQVVTVLALVALPMPLVAQSIVTVAGGGTVDGPATRISLKVVSEVAIDTHGNVFFVDFSDSGQVRRVDPKTGLLRTVAGTPHNPSEEPTGDGGPATAAGLGNIGGITLDEAGNLYISDSFNDVVRRVDATTGVISTFAGQGYSVPRFAGDGGSASEATLYSPAGLAVDSGGNLYIGDSDNHRVRRIDAESRIITTIAGGAPCCDTGDGGAATQAYLFDARSLAVDHDDNVFIGDGIRVRRVDATTGVITTVAGGHGFDEPLGDDGPATEASLDFVRAVAVAEDGDLYIVDSNRNRVRKVEAATGIISTVAGNGERGFSGDDGPATEASLDYPWGLAVDSSRNLYIGDSGNRRLRQVEPTGGIISTFAGNGGDSEYTHDGFPATLATLSSPRGVAVDEEGDLYIADFGNWNVRKVDHATGIISTVAGYSGNMIEDCSLAEIQPANGACLLFPERVAIDRIGNLYVSDIGRVMRIDLANGLLITVSGLGTEDVLGDGGPAISAALFYPIAMAFDDSNDLYIADSMHHRVRRVDHITGVITTVAGTGKAGAAGVGGPATAAELNEPYGLAINGEGNLYIAERSRILEVDAKSSLIKLVSSIGGWSIVPDDTGNLYIANEQIWRLSPGTGLATIVAGTQEGSGGLGDEGPATSARLAGPDDVALDRFGNIFIADTWSGRIRRVSSCAGIDARGLISPADGSTGISSARLTWEAADRAFRYDVYLDTVNPPQRIAASDIETISFSPSNLNPLTTYYWKIVAKGDPFCRPFRTAMSEVWSFTTASSCDAPGEFEPD